MADVLTASETQEQSHVCTEEPQLACGDSNTKGNRSKARLILEGQTGPVLLHGQQALTSTTPWSEALPPGRTGKEGRRRSQWTPCTYQILNCALPGQNNTIKFNFLEEVTQLSGPHATSTVGANSMRTKIRDQQGELPPRAQVCPRGHHTTTLTRQPSRDKAWETRTLRSARNTAVCFQQDPGKINNQESGSLCPFCKPEQAV